MHLLSAQQELFELAPPRLPHGLDYRPEFLTEAEAAQLLAVIGGLDLREARYKGYVARRRIVSYGSQYDFDDNRLLPAAPIPAFLHSLRRRVAQWAGVDAEAFADALVAEYRPGTPLGWHRDVPDFELVAGVSLAASARMRLRRYPASTSNAEVLTLELAARSAYLLRDEARWAWQHSIAPTQALRYSITFRTRRRRAA